MGQQNEVTKAALATTRQALDDKHLTDEAKLLYLDVVARYAGSFGWMVGCRSWDQSHLQELAIRGYLVRSDHGDAVAVPTIDDALRGDDDD